MPFGAVMTGCLPYAKLVWHDATTPENPAFGDVYYMPGHALAETDHNFIYGNALIRRFQSLTSSHFVIGETGFGTGLNFLRCWQLWQAHAPKNAQLTYLSCEAFPLHLNDLETAHAAWPSLTKYAQKLRQRMPPPIAGLHHRYFDTKSVELILALGQARQQFATVTAKVDAWCLDGFAPKCNPDMWSPALFEEIARLSAPHATLASFTAAGAVRRNLEKVGFVVKRVKGYGKKRSAIQAQYQGVGTLPPRTYHQVPWFSLPPKPKAVPQSVTIIGAGIGGLCLGWALRQKGVEVTLYDRGQGPGAGASGNLAGIMRPALGLTDLPVNQFHRAAWLYATAFYDSLQAHFPTIPLYGPKGLLCLAVSPAQIDRFQQMISIGLLPPEYWSVLTPEQATQLANFPIPTPALWYKSACNPYPLAIVKALSSKLQITYEADLKALNQATNGNWQLQFDIQGRKRAVETQHVVLANGIHATKLIADHFGLTLPIQPVAGQITALDPQKFGATPTMALSFGGYLAPHINITVADSPKRRSISRDTTCKLILGAGYDRCDFSATPKVSSQSHHHNLALFRAHWPDYPLDEMAICGGRAGLRASTPDRLPLIGPLPDADFYAANYHDLSYGRHPARYPKALYHQGLYVMCGLGSRGFQLAPLGALFLASCITASASPLPAPHEILLHPARFWVRTAKRAQSKQ